MESKSGLAGRAWWVAALLVVAAARTAGADAQAPEVMQIARWDVMLNDNATDTVEAVDSKMIETKSEVYHAEMYNADALRAGINAAAAAGGLEAGSQSMAHSQVYAPGFYNMQPLYFFYSQNAQSHISMNGNGQGNEVYNDAPGGAIHVSLNYTHLNGQIVELDNGRRTSATSLDKKASILYDGTLNAGDALAFSATIKTKSGAAYRQMIVWEAFKAPQQYQQNFQQIRDSAMWCQLGPTAVRNAADVATVWGSTATHLPSEVTAKWQQKLDDGKVIRLTGISRSDKWMFCWWDADGLPLAVSNGFVSFSKNGQDRPVWFTAEVSGSADEWKMQAPSGHPDNNRGMQQSGPYTTSICTETEPDGTAVIGAPVGPWEKIGQINKGQTIKIGTATYTLQNLQALGDTDIYVNFFPQRGNGAQRDLVALSVVGVDGTEMDTEYLPQISAKNSGYSSSQFRGMALKNVKTFNVWRRKQQWVTFSGFATEPVDKPKDSVTPADLAAAAGAQEKQQMEQRVAAAREQLASLKEKRKSWEAIPADPTTPKGALRVMFAAAGKGDLKSVRARLKSSQPDSAPLLDAVARVITATASARAAAVTRFGEENILALSAGQENMGMPPLQDLEMQMMEETWTPRPDGGLQANDVALTKGDDGQFYLDLGQSKDNAGDQDLKAMLPTFVAMAMHAEQISQTLKDNPTMTFDQFRQTVGAPTPVGVSVPVPVAK